jgi:hypothetical protein
MTASRTGAAVAARPISRPMLANIFLHATNPVSTHPIPASAPSEESCIRKAVAERGIISGLVGLADAKARRGAKSIKIVSRR